ncbi:2TM domain-containing protein [Sporolactobacillus vineae]|uniref:2TM domain-containing protein n=1 Tax=Sporolactobacillus vineae TaxID=444463 RepID=UPI0002884C46|nr:2TM domain-containing protein [Sporolactobacillus vineae]
MIFWLIVADEAGFWLFIQLGLATRYIFKKEKLSLFFLACTPVLDLILLIATFVDLRNGGAAGLAHVLAAVYLGVSVAFGAQIIKWADGQFAYRFAGGTKPRKKNNFGKERAKRERQGWYRHLFAWAIGSGLMLMIHYFAGHPQNTEMFLWRALQWAFIVAIDFIYSFSYTLFPKKEPRG